MNPLLALTTSVTTFLLPLALHAQTADHGSHLEHDPGTGAMVFSWWGKQDWTYFIQSSFDLLQWEYLPLIEEGDDAPLAYGFSFSAPALPFFLRLQATDLPTADPWHTDFGGGVPAGFALERGLDPFDPASAAAADSPYLPLSWLEYYQMQSDLLAHYSLDTVETTTIPDLSGNDRDGQLTGSDAALATIDGITALEVDGDYSGVVFPAVSALDDLTGQNHSLSVWFKAAGLPGTGGLQTDFAVLTQNNLFGIRLNQNERFHARFTQVDTGGNVEIQRVSSTYADWDRWYLLCLAVDYDAGEMRFYIDGQPVGSDGIDPMLLPAATTEPWRIGFSNTGTSHWSARGWFADARLYARALNDDEAAALRQMAPPGLETHGDGLPAWWKWQHFGTLDVDPDADPDGDGLTNLEEYLASTDPNTHNSLILVADTGNDVKLLVWNAL